MESWSVVASVGGAVAAAVAVLAFVLAESRSLRDRREAEARGQAAAEQRALEDLLRSLIGFASAWPERSGDLQQIRWDMASHLSMIDRSVVPSLNTMRLDGPDHPTLRRQAFGPTTHFEVFPWEQAILETTARLRYLRSKYGVLTVG